MQLNVLYLPKSLMYTSSRPWALQNWQGRAHIHTTQEGRYTTWTICDRGERKPYLPPTRSAVEYCTTYLVQFMMYFIEDESLVVVCCVVLHYAMNWIQKMWHMKPQGSPCGYLGLIQQYSIDYVHMHVRLVYWTSPPPTIYTLHPHYTWGEGKVEPITMYMYIC